MAELDVGWRSALLFALTLPTMLAALMLGLRASDRPAFVWLALLLGAWCWHSIPYIIGFAGAYSAFPWLTFAPFNMELWFGPLFYLHAHALANRGRAPRQWLWLLPGLVQFVYYTLCFVLLGDGPSKFAFNNAFHEPYIVPVETAVGLGLAVTGMWLAWREIARYRRWLDQSHSAADAFDPVWLRRFVVGMAVAIAVWVAFDTWSALIEVLHYVNVFWLYVVIGSVFLLLALSGLTHVDVLFPKIAVPETMPESVSESGAGSRAETGVSVDTVARAVRDGELYRDPGLNVSSLARHMGTNESYLSKAINAGAGVNFNRFVNKIRIDEVCRRLQDPANDQSLLDIAMDSGFASKATFNRVFRDLVGEPPGRWRKQARKRLKS